MRADGGVHFLREQIGRWRACVAIALGDRDPPAPLSAAECKKRYFTSTTSVTLSWMNWPL